MPRTSTSHSWTRILPDHAQCQHCKLERRTFFGPGKRRNNVKITEYRIAGSEEWQQIKLPECKRSAPAIVDADAIEGENVDLI